MGKGRVRLAHLLGTCLQKSIILWGYIENKRIEPTAEDLHGAVELSPNSAVQRPDTGGDAVESKVVNLTAGMAATMW